MSKIANLFILAISLLLTACETLPLYEEDAWIVRGGKSSGVIVFRESGSHTKLAPLYFGSKNVFTHQLNEREYLEFSIPAGDHIFRVGGNGSEPSEISESLVAGDTVCLRIGTKAEGWVYILEMPFNHPNEYYAIRKVECPSKEEFAKLKHVSGKQM